MMIFHEFLAKWHMMPCAPTAAALGGPTGLPRVSRRQRFPYVRTQEPCRCCCLVSTGLQIIFQVFFSFALDFVSVTMVDWESKSKSSALDHLDSSMYIQCYSVPTGRVSTLMVRPPSSNSSLDIDIEVAEINNNVGR